MSSVDFSVIRFDTVAIVIGMIFMAIAAVRVRLNCKNLTITFYAIILAFIASVVAIVSVAFMVVSFPTVTATWIVSVASMLVSFFAIIATVILFEQVIEVAGAGDEILFFSCMAVYEVVMLLTLCFLTL